MKKIQLTQGKFALVDDEDFERLNKFSWRTHRNGYAFRHKSKVNPFILMHRQVMNCPKRKVIDHIDGNGFNNQKENLRICINKQNLCNRGKQKNNTSGYKGVFWLKSGKRLKRWLAQIKLNNKSKFFGYYDTAEDAALAYNIAAERYHGEFAKLNKVEDCALKTKLENRDT